MRTTRSVWVSLLLALLAISPAAGQVRSPRGRAPGGSAPKWSALEEAVGKENYLEARKLADDFLQRGAPADRPKAMMVYGRLLLALGQKDQARQYLNGLSKAGAGGELLAVYSAWLTALDKPEEGIKALEAMLEKAGGAPDVTTAEAADVLAMLYMARGEHEKAKKAVDFGLKALEYCGVKGGYVLALLRGRLSSDIAAGEAKRLYNQAEKLRGCLSPFPGKRGEARPFRAKPQRPGMRDPWPGSMCRSTELPAPQEARNSL
jgi:tetratricopeptide (TPR) repeat protein